MNHIRTLILATLALAMALGTLAVDEISWAGDAEAGNVLGCVTGQGSCIWPPYDCVDGVQDCDGPPDS